MADPKLFGKYHDLVLLLIGFLLTAVAGAYIQHRFEAANARAESVDAQRVLATRVYEDVSTLIDRRSHHLLALSAMLRGGAPDSLVQREYRTYLQVYQEWESSINRNRAMVCRFFGYWPDSRFMRLSNDFDKLDAAIVPWTDLKQITPQQVERIHTGVVSMQRAIFPFNNEMAEAIRTGRIGDAAAGERARDCSP